MPDERTGQAPATGPAPGAAADSGTQQPATVRQPAEATNLLRPVPQGSGSSGLTADEESTLAELQAKAARAAAGDDVVEVRLDHPPGTEMQYGGHKIGTDWTTVPSAMLGPLTTAAADGGVTLVQKES
jgi:hypothetical protein